MSQDPRRFSKRSRAGDAAQEKMQNDASRVKRRRTSQSKNELKEEKLAITEIHKSRADDLHTLIGASAMLQNGEMSLKSWSSFSVAAGQYSNLDPIFTPDDDYLLLGLETAVHVYSLATSRLLRTLQLKEGDSIIGYQLSPEDPKLLYIFTSSGSLRQWEWLSGKQCSHWDVCCRTISADVCLDDSGTDQLFFLQERKDGKREIVIWRLSEGEMNMNVVLETNVQISHIKVACQGRFIIAHDEQRAYFGCTVIDQSLGSAQFTWKEVKLSARIVCVDVRHHILTHRPGMSSPRNQRVLDKVDIVFGQSDGSILVNHDVLRSLDDENGRQTIKNTSPRRLHWHRSSVNSVRWSKDGNYIISGGNESVMVLWQLDTGRKQFLPHLSSPIDNIVISTLGNSYAVKLADNSVIVLSARELQPSSAIIGLQLCPKDANLPNQFGPSNSSSGLVAATLHPQNPDQLLITVPASRQFTQDGYPLVNASVLQTYDIRTNRHISRQALARTNATALKIGPEGSSIVTPDVSHMSVSQDGKWMATVDQWSPYLRDMQTLSRSESNLDGHFEGSMDIFLKFWRWNGSSNLWELVTRIDSPHFSNKGPVCVLHLAARAHSHEFATIGSDAVLRFWCPNVRQRSGLKSGDAEQLVETWKCRSAIDLKSYCDTDIPDCLTAASMDFSRDGSVLAVCLGSTSSTHSGLAMLINAQTCAIHYSRVGLYMGLPCAVAFMECHLVIASRQSLSVWDTVNDHVRTIGLSGACNDSATQPRLLAVNSETQSLAISLQCLQDYSTPKKRRTPQTCIHVYDVATLSLLYKTVPGHHPVALLSTTHSGDYVTVDAAANVRRLSHLGKTSQSNHSPDLTLHLNSGLANLFRESGGKYKDTQPTAIPVDLDTTALQGGLGSVFGVAPPFVMPAANMIFRGVVDALAA
ncbi:WD40 repeat-like protein [Aspergillus ellipticus CBS 707.79]|uniref:WD40 repeat-like protein n=1 Tax=Aspergillus ellipticus CBS 707.79 TaxID=1448320 RepID=A0A319ECD6_9EURO|nr:WD40 repeat-like protein [Aspergillus ellipticus CBS 707.79]